MKARDYRQKKRILVERSTKLSVLAIILIELLICNYFEIRELYAGIFITVTWFMLPDIVAYYLEYRYRLKHKTDGYR